MSLGLNITEDNITSLTSNSESNTFTIHITTNDPTTSYVLHDRINQLVTNLGDTAQIDVLWERVQNKRLDNSPF